MPADLRRFPESGRRGPARPAMRTLGAATENEEVATLTAAIETNLRQGDLESEVNSISEIHRLHAVVGATRSKPPSEDLQERRLPATHRRPEFACSVPPTGAAVVVAVDPLLVVALCLLRPTSPSEGAISSRRRGTGRSRSRRSGREDSQKSRGEELVTIHDTVKLLNDDGSRGVPHVLSAFFCSADQ